MAEIRKFRKEDINAIVELIHTTIKLCYPSVYPPGVVNFFLEYHSEEQLKRKAAEGEFVVLISEKNRIIGTGYLLDDEVGGVYIHPDHQRKGHGRFVMEHLIQMAKNKGLSKIWLDATPNAKPMYDKLKFKVVRPAVDMIGEEPLDYFVMEKIIGDSSL